MKGLVTPSRFGRGTVVLVLALLIAAFAAWARGLDREVVFRPIGVVFYGPDAYYHMRRIQYGIERFPEVLTVDPYLHHPKGAPAIWPPLFDTSVAWSLRALGVTDPAEADVWGAWVPVALGALTVFLIAFVGRQLLGSWGAGLLAALALSLLGGHVRYSRVGLLDHHVALGLATLGVLGLGAATLRRDALGKSGALLAVLQGAMLAGAILLWPGCLLFLALWQPVTWWTVLRRAPERRGVVTRAATLTHLVAAGLLAAGCGGSPWARQGLWTLTTLSWLQPLLAAVLAIAWGAADIAARRVLNTRPTLPSRTLSRGALAYGGCLLAALVIGMLFEPVRDSIRGAWTWLAKDEVFQASVAESKPLFRDGPEGYFGYAHQSLSWLVYLVPVLSIAMVIRSWRRREPDAAWLPWVTLVLLVICLLQARFADMASVPVALMLGSLASPMIFETSPRRRVVGAALALIGLWPCWGWVWQQGDRSRTEDEQVQLSATDLYPILLHGTALWIRDHTPQTSGFLEASKSPEYGLMCWWDLGHVLQYTAQRPTVVDNFGDDLGGDHFEAALQFHRTEQENRAVALLERYEAPYVVTRQTPENTRRAEHLRRVVTRLHYFDGRAIEEPKGQIPSLEHFRLLYESRKIVLEDGSATEEQTPPAYKVFELVEGAALIGEATPGSRVECVLRLRSNRGRGFVYRAIEEADHDGRFIIRVPYATHPEGPQAEPGGLYEVRTTTDTYRIAVTESAVRDGERVEVE